MDNKEIERIKTEPNIINNNSKEGKKYKHITIILLSTTVLTIAILFAMDIGMFRTKLTAVMKGEGIGILKKSAEQIKLENERYELYLEREELIKKSENLNNLEVSLKVRRAEIEKKEKEISKKEEEIEKLKEELSTKLINYQEIAKMYEKMEPLTAANTIKGMQNRELAVYILKNIKSDLAANILSLMKPEEATLIIDEMTSAKRGGEEDDESYDD